MRIEGFKTIWGPNVISHKPVVVMTLALEDLAERESYEVPGFVDRLLAALPGITEHHCGLGRPGGFVERLRGGTYFGHIVEHVALELTDAVGISVNRGKTVETSRPGVYDVAVEFRSEAGMKSLLRTAVDFVQALVEDKPFTLDAPLAAAREEVAAYELGPSSRAIFAAAVARNIPAQRLNEASLFQLGYGRKRRYVEAAITSQTSAVGVDIATDKDLTKALLKRAEIPTPQGRVIRSETEVAEVLAQLNSPFVIKPLDSNQGKGVTLNVRSQADAEEAFRVAARYSDQVIVEEFFAGCDYRVLVVNGKMVAAARREPAQVVGDGFRTIEELIAELNRDPARAAGHSSALSHVPVDDLVHTTLRRQGLDLNSVPSSGRVVHLRENANLSTGGYAVDVTDEVHPDFVRMTERAARMIELDVCGVDLVVPDISRPWESGGVVELNAAPGLRMHLHPSHGKPRDVGKAIVDMMYPGDDEGRVPIIAITGTNGKTTTTRLAGHILSAGGSTVGVTTTDGISIGNEVVVTGDTTGPRSARVVLSDSRVDYAVLETARGGIVRNGLGYDWSDVGVMTNITADHVGQDGIQSIDDIVRIKGLVAERVKPNGTLVLNADDPVVAAIPSRPKVSREPKKIVWFSLQHATPMLNDHRTMGGTVYFARDGWLIEAEGIAERRIIELASVPLTMNGQAPFQIANVLAAVGAVRAVGCEIEQVRTGLLSFGAEHNPGRVNVWQTPRGYLIFDYGHNTAAIEASATLADTWEPERLTAVISIPGDRAHSIIEDAGRMVGRHFDRVILREEEDLRGSVPGEVTDILHKAILQESPDCDVLRIAEAAEAVDHVIETMLPGEVAVIYCENCSDVERLVHCLDCGPVNVPDPGYLTEVRRTSGHGQTRIA